MSLDPEKKKAIETKIRDIVDEYAPILLVTNYIFQVVYEPKKCGEAVAQSLFEYPYMVHVLRYGDNMVEVYDAGCDMTPFVVHELCHAITDPLYNYAFERWAVREQVENERERLTDHIKNIVIKLKTGTSWHNHVVEGDDNE